MKSEVENVLATQQNQMPMAWKVKPTFFVFVLSFISEAVVDTDIDAV